MEKYGERCEKSYCHQNAFTQSPSQQSIPCCQIALSVTDLLRTHQWYQRVFGFQPGGEKTAVSSVEVARVQGLPEVSLSAWWLMDSQERFQLELLEYERPRMRLQSADWRPCDIGYTTLGLHVTDFDAALDRIARIGGRLLTAPLGSRGGRRVCLHDPEGVLLEVMEDEVRLPGAPARPHPEIQVAVRSITLSVMDLDRARKFWVDTLGLIEVQEITLHHKEHEALWGLKGAARKSILLWAGDFLIELVQYIDPEGKPRPAGYMICDQGLSHIALMTTVKQDLEVVYGRAIQAGYRGNSEPWAWKNLGTGVYMNDDQGFTVELTATEPGSEELLGFHPAIQPTST